MTDHTSDWQGDHRRARFYRDVLLPHVEAIAKDQPALQSVLFLVAQYWDDEANDAVHYVEIWSELERPDFKSGVTSLDSQELDEVNFRTLRLSQHDVATDFIRSWDDNLGAIPLFACFCTEGANQDMDYADSYSPLVQFVRLDGSWRHEVVGKKVRPWLDGVRPEWGGD